MCTSIHIQAANASSHLIKSEVPQHKTALVAVTQIHPCRHLKAFVQQTLQIQEMVEVVLITVILLIVLEVVVMDLQTIRDLIPQLLLARIQRILLTIHRHLTQVRQAITQTVTQHQTLLLIKTLLLALEGCSSDLD